MHVGLLSEGKSEYLDRKHNTPEGWRQAECRCRYQHPLQYFQRLSSSRWRSCIRGRFCRSLILRCIIGRLWGGRSWESCSFRVSRKYRYWVYKVLQVMRGRSDREGKNFHKCRLWSLVECRSRLNADDGRECGIWRDLANPYWSAFCWKMWESLEERKKTKKDKENVWVFPMNAAWTS